MILRLSYVLLILYVLLVLQARSSTGTSASYLQANAQRTVLKSIHGHLCHLQASTPCILYIRYLHAVYMFVKVLLFPVPPQGRSSTGTSATSKLGMPGPLLAVLRNAHVPILIYPERCRCVSEL